MPTNFDPKAAVQKPKFLRLADVARMLGVSRWTLRRIQEEDPSFPRERAVSSTWSAYSVEEIEQWVAARPVVDAAARRARAARRTDTRDRAAA